MRDIVIGNSIGALRHSFYHGVQLFMNGEPPFAFSKDREEWDKLYAYLSLKSLIPFGDIMSTVTVFLDENKIEARTRGVKRYFEYDNLWIYNDENVGGLEFHIQEENDEFDVYDIFHIKNVQPSIISSLCDAVFCVIDSILMTFVIISSRPITGPSIFV